MTMASRTATTIEIGTRSLSAARPATGTRTRRISSVAYAVDEMASEAKTVSAVGRPRRVVVLLGTGERRPDDQPLQALSTCVASGLRGIDSRQSRRSDPARCGFRGGSIPDPNLSAGLVWSVAAPAP